MIAVPGLVNKSEKHPPAAADSAGHLSNMPTGGGGETWISSMDMHIHCAERVWYLLGCLAASAAMARLLLSWLEPTKVSIPGL